MMRLENMDSWKKFKVAKLKELGEHEKANRADAGIMPLVHKINSSPDFVTTSSCAGRIVLLEYDIEKGKKTADFFRKWHRVVSSEEVELGIADHGENIPLWFKVEPFILHVAAKDVKAAVRFLSLVRSVGVKRGGIQTIGKGKVMIEVQGNGQMIIPVGPVNGEWTAITAMANRMLNRNREVLKKMEMLKWKS
jgi:tRNA wybutosine-synthesizing protein 3